MAKVTSSLPHSQQRASPDLKTFFTNFGKLGRTEGKNTNEKLYAAERPKALFDAVVAIAMTLLILPLMESVGEVADASGTTLRGSNG